MYMYNYERYTVCYTRNKTMYTIFYTFNKFNGYGSVT